METQKTMMLTVAVEVAVAVEMVPMPMETPAAHAVEVVTGTVAAPVAAPVEVAPAEVATAEVATAVVAAAVAVVSISLRMLIADHIKAPDCYKCTSMDSKSPAAEY